MKRSAEVDSVSLHDFFDCEKIGGVSDSFIVRKPRAFRDGFVPVWSGLSSKDFVFSMMLRRKGLVLYVRFKDVHFGGK